MPASATALLVALALRRTLLLRLRGLWGALRTLLLRPALTARRLPVTTLLEPPLLLAIASTAALAALLVASRVAALRVRSLIAPLLRVATWLARGCWRRNALNGSRRWRPGLSLEPAEKAIDDSGVRFARSSLHRGGLRFRHQHDVDLEPRLELLDLGALLVEQERRDVHRHLRVHRAGVLLHRLFLHDPQHVQRGRLGAADEASAAAARAADVRGFFQRGLQALARQLHEAEARDLADLHAGAVELQRVAQAVLHIALVALRFHVDEIDHDQSAKVAQAQLARHLFGCLQIGA